MAAPMRADLHLYSKYSGAAAEWIFRRIGLPASYSEPSTLYENARLRGMGCFTITDRDTIDGVLSIAGKPGVFLSEEVTAQFPEDRASVRILVWGITEADHREIQQRRDNIYELHRYLADHQLAHAVAHPLHRLDEKLRTPHIEKLLLLFKHFETINGTRDALTSDIARHILSSLTEVKLLELSDRHGITPIHERPWEKTTIGGSNDRSGIFTACAWTEVEAEEPASFLAGIRAGRCKAGGNAGGPLAQAHGLYNSLFQFVSEKSAGIDRGGLIGKAFSRFMEGENPTEFSLPDKLGFLAHGIVSGKIFELAKPRRASIWKQFSKTFRDGELKAIIARETEGMTEPERRAFITACLFADRLLYRFFTAFVKKLSAGNPIDAMQDISLMVPVALALAPYFVAFRQSAPDRAWLRDISTTVAGMAAPQLANVKRAWFTDTLEDVNGVATTIRKMTSAAVENGHALTVVTSRAGSMIAGMPLQNFEPIGEFELPEYELQKLSFPPVLKIIDYIQREGFTELIISTPGPVGLTALLAARLLGLRTAGIYHTDFPQYVRILTDDRSWETLAWTFMRTFYAQMDTIWVNSECYRQSWIQRGIDERKLRIFPRGLDSALFRADRRSGDFWKRYGAAPGSTVLLYVGRISKEKNLTLIADAWEKITAPGLALAFVGDGPFLPEMQRRLPSAIFTGYLSGEDLATAFASADVFLFPSTTDTFGNVILEALASGLPCIVSDEGGPRDLIEHGVTGFVTRANNLADFTEAIRSLSSDGDLRARMRGAAIAAVAGRDWHEAARRWWDATA